jgi:hypothetical protein
MYYDEERQYVGISRIKQTGLSRGLFLGETWKPINTHTNQFTLQTEDLNDTFGRRLIQFLFIVSVGKILNEATSHPEYCTEGFINTKEEWDALMK